MANKRFSFGILVMVLVFGIMVVGCASRPAISLLNGPHPTLSSVNVISEKIGTASSTVFLGIGKTTYPTISEAARNGGITKIASIEYYTRPVFFTIVVEYTTIVTGE